MIKKETSTFYLGIKMTSELIKPDMNDKRGKSTLQKAEVLETAAILGELNERNRENYVVKTHLRIVYTYKALLLPSIDKFQSIDEENICPLAQAMLNNRRKGIKSKGLNVLMALLHILPLYWKLSRDARRFRKKIIIAAKSVVPYNYKGIFKATIHSCSTSWLMTTKNAPILLQLFGKDNKSQKAVFRGIEV